MSAFTCVIIAMMIGGIVCPPNLMEDRHKRDDDDDNDNTCVFDDEIDICPKNMTCTVDENKHRVCHYPGENLPNSQCLPENDYEPYYVNAGDITGHEDCQSFASQVVAGQPIDNGCEDKKICCRTRHGHHCFYKSKATSLRDNIVYIDKPE